jgi:hypothetical protein
LNFVFWQELAKIIPDIANVMRQYEDNRIEQDDAQDRIDSLYARSRCKPYLVGRLSGTYAGANGVLKSFVSAVLTKLNVGTCCGGADSEFSVNLGRANLNASGGNYQVVLQAGRTILPGQEVSFAVDLTVSESSIHDLIFQVVTDSGTFQSLPYQVRVFIPWSSVIFAHK